MIDPGEIPEFTGDLVTLAGDIKGLNGDAGRIRGTGRKVHDQFQGLSAYYHAPEAEQLFATTRPVRERADAFAGKLEKVTAALEAYATEVRPIIARLKQLKIDAAAFVKECGHGDHWKFDGGKVKRNNALMQDVAAATAAFWDAERRAANAITALVGGSGWTTDDGSHQPGMYGYKAGDLEHAEKTPWGSQDSQKHHIYDVGHWTKAFFWDGLVVDGAWSTLKGLGTLAGFGGWDAFKQSWTGLGHLAVGLAVPAIVGPAGLPLLLLTPDKDLPGFLKDGKHAVVNAGKGMAAWDEWGKNPARAAGAVTFNVLTAVATDGAGDAAKAGGVAKAISIAGKGGRLIDPMTYVVKGAGLGLTKLKVGDLLGNLKNLHAGTGIKLPDDTLKLPDSSLPHPGDPVHIPDGVPVHTGAGHPGDPVHIPAGVPGHPTTSVHVPHGAPAHVGAGHPGDPAHVPHGTTPHPGDPAHVPHGTTGHPGDPAHVGAGHPGDPGGVHGSTDPATPAHPSGGSGGAHPPSGGAHHVSTADFDLLSDADKAAVAKSEISHGAVPFHDSVDAARYGQEHWNDYAEHLPAAQKSAVFDYTMEPPHSGPTYREMNGYLRGNASLATPDVLHDIDEIDKAMKGNPVPNDLVVVRGSDLGHIPFDPDDMAGRVFEEKAYVSTSIGDHPVPAFAGKEAVLHLRVPEGTPALYVEKVSAFGGDERELLLGRGLQYRVDRVFWDDTSGQWQIYGEYLK